MYLFWRKGARVAVNWELRDPGGSGYFQSGLYFPDGSPKPSLQAVRFPLASRRLGKRRIEVWGKVPTSGLLRIQKRVRGKWRTKRRLRVGNDDVFKRRISARGRTKLRGKLGSEVSLVWRQRR